MSPQPDETKHVLEDFFNCHPLLVEDCVKLNQRPKMDRYKNNIFIAFFSINKENDPLEVAIVVGTNYVISIYKEQIPVLDNLYEEI